jgi:hypothetical protein
VRRPSTFLLAAALAAGLAACGNERQRPPDAPRATEPAGKRSVDLRRWGVRFERPANWGLAAPRPPQIATLSSGQVAVSFWRYPRDERLPRSASELQRARRALIAAARGRDRSLRVLSARAVRVGGAPGVELVATQRMGVARRKVRSTHLYAHGGELVVDAYAPPTEFARVDRSVFRPLLRSLRLGRPVLRPRS